eukprot:m.100284 g.100284  ORF g.100284 m.100284 type:complete len:279 (-) comp12550_c0_seq6:2020-2856(-)
MGWKEGLTQVAKTPQRRIYDTVSRRNLLALGLCVVVVVVFFLKQSSTSTPSESEIPSVESVWLEGSELTSTKVSRKDLEKIQSFVSKVFYMKYQPVSKPKKHETVVFLHGAHYNSMTWESVGTPQSLQRLGYTSFCIDLPSFGKSEGKVPRGLRATFLKILFESIGAKNVVLVSPSMSGVYSIPLVMEKDVHSFLSGYIPIAPSAVDIYDEKDYESLHLPSLVVYGTKDTAGAIRSETLQKIIGAVPLEVKDGTHPCYLDFPEFFNYAVLDFIKGLST